MSNTAVRVLDKLTTEDGEVWGWSFFCPACDHGHVFYMPRPGYQGPTWTFDGNEETPSFTASLLNMWEEGPTKVPQRCHLYVTAGRIQYLSDCTHPYAGLTVPMVLLPPATLDG